MFRLLHCSHYIAVYQKSSKEIIYVTPLCGRDLGLTNVVTHTHTHTHTQRYMFV